MSRRPSSPAAEVRSAIAGPALAAGLTLEQVLRQIPIGVFSKFFEHLRTGRLACNVFQLPIEPAANEFIELIRRTDAVIVVDAVRQFRQNDLADFLEVHRLSFSSCMSA